MVITKKEPKHVNDLLVYMNTIVIWETIPWWVHDWIIIIYICLTFLDFTGV